jgi:GR25 family glycosyltransferase involved in LPS biosynthesis
MKGYYINLEARIDRRSHFEKNILSIDFFKGIDRFHAIEHADGPVGCGLSHITALKKGLQEHGTDEYICIFEDDFMILHMDNMKQFIENFEYIKTSNVWNVIVLTPRGNTVESNPIMTQYGFKKIVDNQTATGYIVKTNFVPILIANLEQAVQNMLYGKNKDIYAIDQYWKELQKTHAFYYYSNIFGGQLSGWSNNENRHVDYNQRFIQQYLY